jgi:hypothetical protein
MEARFVKDGKEVNAVFLEQLKKVKVGKLAGIGKEDNLLLLQSKCSSNDMLPKVILFALRLLQSIRVSELEYIEHDVTLSKTAEDINISPLRN